MKNGLPSILMDRRTSNNRRMSFDEESKFLEFEKSDSENMNNFLKALSDKFPDDEILLCLDRASWHTSKKLLVVPNNIVFFHLPPRTPEMNPIEQIWKEIRKLGFKNRLFGSIQEVIDRFNDVIRELSKETIISITLRDWIAQVF